MNKHGARPLRSTRRLQLQNLTSALPKWYSIVRNQSGPTLVSIYDEIGFYGVSASDFMAELTQVPGDIELHLNSPGGDVFDGIAIFNQLTAAQQRGTVHVIVDGLAASAASFIAMAASPGKLEMAPHSRMMIHDGFGLAIGNAADMREMADLLDDASDNIASIYAGRTGKPADYWRAKMRTETWYSGEQAIAEGLADGIHGQKQDPANSWDLSVFTGSHPAPAPAAPDAPPAPVSATVARDAHCPACEHPTPAGTRFCASCGTRVAMADASGWVQDPDGSWRFDPDGDGDNDATPEGDTDHDYFAPDGSPIPGKEIPPCPGQMADLLRTGLLNADVDNSPWDASKAWHNGASSDDPAAFYRGICAGRKAGDPSTQDAWALPFKYHPSDPPNAAGVRAALGRLSSTEGLTNEAEARSKLEGLMKEINPDYEPADLTDTGLLAAALLTGLGRG